MRSGNVLVAAGRYPWAREVYCAATQLAPNRAGGFQGLAAARESLAAVEARTGAPPSDGRDKADRGYVRHRAR